MGEPLELKKTLNLPKTDFPMKAGLPQNEPKQLAAWEDSHLYEQILAARKGFPQFVLHDGPPYPTGTIHLGTGLNKILKDMIVKSNSMAGHYAPYVPGWHCHGLPIETQVETELGGKWKVAPAEFRRLCREFATRYVEQHKRDFKRLGALGRWDDPYLTMSHDYEATIAGALLEFMEKGFVYRGRKPVYCDRWMLERAAGLVKNCRQWYAAYDLHRVFHAIHEYCVVDLSAFYFDVLKDRLFTRAARNPSRRSPQTAIWKITSALVRLAAPILVFTAEEIWMYMPQVERDAWSVHIARFSEVQEFYTGLAASVTVDWELLAEIRGEALKALETARNAKRINSSLEAKVNFELFTSDAETKLLGLLRKYEKWLPALLIVSQVGAPADSRGHLRTCGLHGDSFRSEIFPGLVLRVIGAAGTKCERCWNYSTHVGENARYPGVCERCSEALADIEASEPSLS